MDMSWKDMVIKHDEVLYNLTSLYEHHETLETEAFGKKLESLTVELNLVSEKLHLGIYQRYSKIRTEWPDFN